MNTKYFRIKLRKFQDSEGEIGKYGKPEAHNFARAQDAMAAATQHDRCVACKRGNMNNESEIRGSIWNNKTK